MRRVPFGQCKGAGDGGGGGGGVLFFHKVYLFLRDAKLLLRDFSPGGTPIFGLYRYVQDSGIGCINQRV